MIKKMIDMSEKIFPRFLEWKKQWGEPDEMDLSDYVSFNIHPEDALSVLALTNPAFVEVDGCVFLGNNFEADNHEKWRDQFEGDKYKLQLLINHVHIYDLFANCNDDVEDSVFEKVGEFLKCSYAHALKSLYPERVFVVSLSIGDEDYGPVLTFYEKTKLST